MGFQRPAPAVGRVVFLVLWVSLAVLTSVAAACGGTTAEPAPQGRDIEMPTAGAVVVTVYSSPSCGCCGEYEKYLKQEGFQVKGIKTEDMEGGKDRLGVPRELQSCHSAVVGDYFVEGHVPVEAIQKLLREQPAIDGIALPGMPAGSPGMGGTKAGPFVIYAIADGHIHEFARI